MYDRVDGDYPIQEPVFPDFGPNTDSLFQAQGDPFVDRIRLKAADDSRLLQLGRDRLVLNQLKPYPGWIQLRPHVLVILDHYLEIAHPVGLHDISVRYINQIDVRDETKLDDLFSFRPVVHRLADSRFLMFSLSGTFQYSDGDRLDVQLAAIEPAEGSMQSFVLDLDYTAAPENLPNLSDVGEWLDNAHGHIEEAFEQIILQPVRDLMVLER